MIEIPNAILLKFKDLIGQPCCRQRIGRFRSISLGFGKKIPHGSLNRADYYYGEWELGSYRAAWRLVRDKVILCASGDLVDSLYELDENLQRIELDSIKQIEQVSEFDFCIYFSNGIRLEFFTVTSDDDEILHLFCPDGSHLSYSLEGRWQIGRA